MRGLIQTAKCAVAAMLLCASSAQAVNLYIFSITGTGEAVGNPLAAATATASFSINADPGTGGAAPNWNFSGAPPGALTAFTGVVFTVGGGANIVDLTGMSSFELYASPTGVTSFNFGYPASTTPPLVTAGAADSNASTYSWSTGSNTITWNVAGATITQFTDIPEPEALASTLAAAALGLVALRRRRKDSVQA